MRRGSFKHTGPQMRGRTKHETRRLTWLWAKPGIRVLAVSQCRGLRKGQSPEVFGVIEIVAVRRERLDAIDQAGVIAEGFPELTPAEFVAMFCRHMRCRPSTKVTAVRFRHID